jgi:dipeptidyl aminopeptidase/acylaminoacyl peptidase
MYSNCQSDPLNVVQLVARGVALCVVTSGSLSAQLKAPLVQTSREMVVDANREQLISYERIVLTPDGGLIVPQRRDGQLLFFDNTGKRLATVGRMGQGPGEFTDIGRMGWRSDTLWVADSRDYRISQFTSAGKFIRTVRFTRGTASVPANISSMGVRELVSFEPVAMLSSARFIGSVRGIRSDAASTADDASAVWYAKITTDWKNVEIVTPRPMPKIGPTVTMTRGANQDGSFAVAQIPFLPEPRSAISAGGDRIATAIIEMRGDNGVVNLKVLDTTGRAVVEQSWPFTGVAIAPGELQKLVDQIQARKSQPANVKAQLVSLVREQFPRVYPPVTDLRLTRDGSIWIELGNHLDTRTWLRLDARGNPVHTIALPRNARFEESDGNVVWASETDDMNLRSVVRYRIR